MQLLQTLCAIHAPSGNEGHMKSSYWIIFKKKKGIGRQNPKS